MNNLQFPTPDVTIQQIRERLTAQYAPYMHSESLLRTKRSDEKKIRELVAEHIGRRETDERSRRSIPVATAGEIMEKLRPYFLRKYQQLNDEAHKQAILANHAAALEAAIEKEDLEWEELANELAYENASRSGEAIHSLNNSKVGAPIPSPLVGTRGELAERLKSPTIRLLQLILASVRPGFNLAAFEADWSMYAGLMKEKSKDLDEHQFAERSRTREALSVPLFSADNGNYSANQ